MSIGWFVLLALLGVTAHADAQVSKVSVPGFDGGWEIDERSAKVGNHLGRPAILVRGNFPPFLAADVDFTDGTIEFDMSAMPGAHFVGFVFRYADGANHENVYFRLHKSGEFEAVQYAPRVNGSGGTWQLYPQFFGAATLPVDGWVHVRADIRGSAMQLFVGDSINPLIVVPRLRGLPASGRVGIWGRVNEKPLEWAAAISNYRIRRRAPAAIAAVDTSALPPGTLTGWQVAGPYAAPDSTVLPAMPGSGSWTPIAVQELGLVNVTTQLRKPGAGRYVAYLRNIIAEQSPRLAALEIGYSDDIVIWLNGKPLYEGRNSLGSRYPGFLGVTSMVERVYLPLRAGNNELMVALSDRIGGWGLMARIVPPTVSEIAPAK